MKIVVGASSFAAADDTALNKLRGEGVEVELNPYGRKMTEEEIIRFLQGADGILAGLESLDRKVLASAGSLKAIARIGIGMDNVDTKAAKELGIKVSNTPDGPTQAVAEMTVAALLTIARQIVPANRDIHDGIWAKRMGFSVSGCKVLVIGYGRIGKKVAETLKYLGADIHIYDKYNMELTTINPEEGLKWADVVTLHASGNEEIIGEKEISIMKEGVILLNGARGALVDEDSLYHALSSGKMAYYWGDAFWQEPYQGKIMSCLNAILTPHIGSYTKQCRKKMEIQAVDNILRDLGLCP